MVIVSNAKKIRKSVLVSAIFVFGFGILGLFSFEQRNPEETLEVGKAELYLTPGQGTFNVGKTFQVKMQVDADTEINSASAKLLFPVDKLEVVELSEAESIFTLWAQEPFYSNDEGIIQFSGGLPTPGFKGKEGQILTVIFKPKQAGEATIGLAEGLVLANDGKGTDILKSQKGASYIFNNPIPSDLNSDGAVGLPDLSILLSNWGIPKEPKADLNQDGKVNIADFSILIFHFF